MRAPQLSPALRSASMWASSCAMLLALAAKKALSAMCCSPSNGISISPSALIQPVKVVPCCCAQPLARHRAGRHRGRRQPRRRAPAATRVAQAVLAPVGVVGMAGAEGVEDVAVVLAALVGVADQQADRRAGGQALVDAREDLHRVGLVALRHVAAGAGAAAVEFGLDVGFAQRHAGRAAVDHAADGRAVAFAEVGDAKEFAEGAARHAGILEGPRRASRLGPRTQPVVVSLPSAGQSRM